MGDFGYIFGYSLIFAFLIGGLIGWLCSETRFFRAKKRKPMAVAEMVKVLEAIIRDWDGGQRELEALIMLENMVLYRM